MKKLTILNSEWEIRTEDDNVEQYFNDIAFDYLDRHLYAYLLEILTMFDYGNSFTEPVFKLKDTRTMGKKVCLTDLKTRAPHSMEYHTDNKGDIEFYRQLAENQNIDMKPGKYIHMVHNQEFQNPYGKSDFNEGVYTAWWSKQIVIKFMNIYLERYGAPTVIAKYKAGLASTSQKEDMHSFVKNLSSKSGGVFPDNFDVSLLEATRGGQNPFIETIDAYNLMISRAMLNPDLTGFGGSETQGGSYALGEQQFDAWYMSLELPKKQLVKMINRKIVYPLVLWNFGPEAAANTEFVMQTVSEQKKAEQAKIYIEAVKGGVTPAVLDGVNTMLKAIGYPEITEEDIEDAKPDPIPPALDKDNPQEAENGPDEIEEEQELSPRGEKEKKLDFTTSKYDFQRAGTELTELDETWTPIVAAEFDSSINAMVAHIQKRKIIENKRLDLVNEIDLPHKAKIRKAFKGMLKESYKTGDLNAADSIPSKFSIEQSNALDDVAGWIGSTAEMLTDTQAQEILKHVKPILIESIRSGKGLTETMTEIDVALRGWDIQLDAPRIENIVRTNTAQAWNQAKLDRYQTIQEDIQAYEFSAIMDSRTSDICIALDGKIIRKSEVDKYNPPLHYQCRSTLIPIFIDEPKAEFSTLPATKSVGGFMELAK